MTVKELRAKLAKMPQDVQVFYVYGVFRNFHEINVVLKTSPQDKHQGVVLQVE